MVFTVGFFLYQLHASFALLMGIGQKMGLGPDSAYFRLLKAQETLIVDETLWGLLISINFVITHRTLGPFYRLKVCFKNYTRGSGEKIRFRETDYFKEIEEDINKALE